ncbi:hypothetical protein ABPG77_001462 [Micractinium sp. CCAP 211/92]
MATTLLAPARSAPLWAVLALALSASVHAACGTSSPFVGFEGSLTEMEHNVGGTVKILDDCTFQVTGFTYDGNAPAAYWWGAPSIDNGDIRRSGRRIADTRLEQAYDGATITVTLLDGVSWDDVPYLLLWCEDYYADFGHIKLEKVSRPSAPSPEPSPPEPVVEPSPPPEPVAEPSPPPEPVAESYPAAPPVQASPSPAAAPGPEDVACGKTSLFVGFSGELEEGQDGVSGRVSILDDCTFLVEDFSFDGAAPAVHFWGAPSLDNQGIRQIGRRLSPLHLDRAYVNETFSVKLDPGLSWDMFPYLIVWCESFNADLGHVALAAEAAAPAPGPSIDSTGLGLANCLELKKGYYNLHWEVADSGTEIVIGLEGRVGPGNRWMGFGFSPVNATDVTMPGSDAVVAGMVGGECFALDYLLQIRSQCSYPEMSGVCPDSALSGNQADNQVQLLSCEKVGDVLAVMLMRPVAASDVWDRTWPLDGSGFPVWAMGPVSEGSTADKPVVLYHRFQLPGTASEEIIHAPVGQGYRINLGAPSPPSSCAPLLAAASMTPAPEPAAEAGGAAPGPEDRTVATLRGVQQFDIVTGDNKHYPNPPGWGLSYHVNGEESPVLEVVRGTTYTFRVMAGDQHPLYLTSSIVGGGSYGNFTGETIYAGGLDSHGTPQQPFLLAWTPDASTPDLLYYQCAIHQKLGWEVRVANAA